MILTYFRHPLNVIDRRSGVVDLASNEKVTFSMVQGLGVRDPVNDVWDSVYVRWFREAHFYEPDADSPYKSYVYESIDCLGVYCDQPGDDSQVLYESSDGATEQLFLESPDRPFYLERDADNRRLARVVITFVPSADPIAASSGIRE